MRNEFGRNFGKEFAVWTAANPFLSKIYSHDKTDYAYLDGLFAFGLDFRMQTTRSHKTENASRKYYPMQAALYANSQPWDFLQLVGTYNFGKNVFRGQRDFAASAIIRPAKNLPSLRFGYFSPSLGILDCDMAALYRRTAVPDGTEQLIPPSFAEAGFEINYDALEYLSIEAGMFDSQSLDDILTYGGQLSIVEIKGNPTFNSRVVFWPAGLFNFSPVKNLGASGLVNGEFAFYSAFTEIALSSFLSVSAKYAGTNQTGIRATDNFLLGVRYSPVNGTILGLRGETGSSVFSIGPSTVAIRTNQLVASARVFPVPYAEILAEYRIIDCEDYVSGRAAFQLHIFY